MQSGGCPSKRRRPIFQGFRDILFIAAIIFYLTAYVTLIAKIIKNVLIPDGVLCSESVPMTIERGNTRMKRRFCLAAIAVLLLAWNGVCADTTYSVPEHTVQLGMELEELPEIRTKQADGIITVAVTGNVDYLMANWQGYMEQPEEIELTDGVGQVQTKGHRYQLGARWNNVLHYITVENFFRHEDVSDEELMMYFDALVACGDARVAGMNPVSVIIRHLIPEYRTRQTIETFDAGTGEISKEAIVLKATPVSQVSEEELQQMMEDLPDDAHEELADGSYTNKWYAISESAYKVLEYAIGLASNGAPDRAFLGASGNYVLAWGRSGQLKTATKVLQDYDCFGTGIGGATSYIIWDNSLKLPKHYISDVVTYYPEGSELASINAEYECNGALKRFTVAYSNGRQETVDVRQAYVSNDN